MSWFKNEKTDFVNVSILDNFYQTSSFYPMPVVICSSVSENGLTNLGSYSLCFPFGISKDYYMMLISRSTSKWTENQRIRAQILFEEYPIIKQAYEHIIRFRNIYECKVKSVAKDKLEQWIQQNSTLGIKEFNTAARSIEYHLENVLNFFDNRSTNAFAESFNSKIKLFRANSRGLKDVTFFLFRIAKLFA